MGWAGPGVNREHPLLLPVAELNELLIDAVLRVLLSCNRNTPLC